MTRARTCLFGLVLAFADLGDPRLAGACSVSTLDRGLSLRDDTRPLVIAGDGVIAFDAYIRGESIEAGLARFSMTLTPDAGGPAITGSVSHRLLGSKPFDLTDDLHQIVLVWRPDVSLPPGAYTVAGHVDSVDFGPVDWTEPLTVTDVPAPPLSPPIVERAAPVSSVVEELDRVCCETGQDSCGGHTICLPTRVRRADGFELAAALAEADIDRAYLWVAPWDGQAPGLPYPRFDPWGYGPGDRPYFSAWPRSGELLLPEAVGATCIVIGATSLIDGSDALSDPICADLVAAREEPGITAWPAQEECISEPFYEEDGRPFPAGESGCRLAGSPPGLVLLALLLLRRRRRS